MVGKCELDGLGFIFSVQQVIFNVRNRNIYLERTLEHSECSFLFKLLTESQMLIHRNSAESDFEVTALQRRSFLAKTDFCKVRF